MFPAPHGVRAGGLVSPATTAHLGTVAVRADSMELTAVSKTLTDSTAAATLMAGASFTAWAAISIAAAVVAAMRVAEGAMVAKVAVTVAETVVEAAVATGDSESNRLKSSVFRSGRDVSPISNTLRDALEMCQLGKAVA